MRRTRTTTMSHMTDHSVDDLGDIVIFAVVLVALGVGLFGW